ncbi:hypothetical protein DRH29_03905 [candidate division Kazan bacterium]|uniref:Ribbon-helix-helix protein CopG domain-containing protein n=1 Tax=candidate division Kazan bacterium TaxID=2202143 RepID=A0A420ZC64_UNCK3|nr:MAG: hypothetical protein DRH29_03905 [candidate division Kazan bacterium]
MPNIKVPEELYEKIKKMAEEQGKAMWEVIQVALDKMEVGNIQINLPKPKFIRLQYPAWCVLGNHKVDPQKYKEKTGRDLYALWFPGLNGVVCIDCLIRHVFTEDTQAKTLAKLEVEIRKLRAIKRQLNKEIEELSIKYSFAELLSKLSKVVDAIDEEITRLDYLLGGYVSGEKREEVSEIKKQLGEISEQLKRLEMPESWLKKGLEKMGIIKIKRRAR